MALAKEVVRYDRILKIENENLQKEIEELKAEKDALRMRTEAANRSAEQKMQEFWRGKLPYTLSNTGLPRRFQL